MNQGLRSQEWELDALLQREWLTANGIGGYACSTIPGLNTRKYHGLLVASMAPPVRRMVLLSRVEETVWCRGQRFALDCNEYPGVIYPQGHRHFREFFPGTSPRWIYEGEGWRIEKRLALIHGSNTVVLTYKLLEGDEIDLQLRPLMPLRPIHDLTYQFNGRLTVHDRDTHHHRVAPTSKTPEVFFAHDGSFVAQPNWYINQIYRREQERGYAGLEDLWTPGVIRFHLATGKQARFACSTDPIDLRKLKPGGDQGRLPASADPNVKMLCEAAAQFVVERKSDGSTAVVAGYPWIGPRTRDALIGFTGLFLVQRRFDRAQSLLMSLAERLKNGLIPSEFPEDGQDPLYRSADVSLWFANAVWHYLRYDTDADQPTVQRLLDTILAVIDAYRAGVSDLGITVDADGLLASTAPGEATSWMDARVADCPVTPRAGKPVELNALWYNAIRIAAALCDRVGQTARAQELKALADSVSRAFNQRFWNVAESCCFDVITDTGVDASIRPNQILAASLPFPVLSVDRHEALLNKVRTTLLVPMGIRTLAPSDPNYKPRYVGNAPTRDAAHHNGPAFPWLLGPYAQLLLRVHGRTHTRSAIATILAPCLQYAADQGTGQIPELFDADPPHNPGGVIASAASVGQLLRCYVEDVLGKEPSQPERRTMHRPRHPRRFAGHKVSLPARDASLPPSSNAESQIAS